MEYATLKPVLEKFNLKNNTVFLRVDLNIPIDNDNIIGDFKLTAITPTLNYLLDKKAIVILATHIGRPNNENRVSTKSLLPWFIKKGYKIEFAATLHDAKEMSNNPYPPIILLENLRFFSGEQKKDIEFAQALKDLAIFYINDAFGALHRTDTSITILPNMYDHNHKSIGFLIEKEIKTLKTIRENPKKPYTIILGGGKAKDKLPILEDLIEKCNIILLGPGLSNIFMNSKISYLMSLHSLDFTTLSPMHQNPNEHIFGHQSHLSQSRSLTDQEIYLDKELFTIATRIIIKANKFNVKLILPLDYLVSEESFNGPYKTVDIYEIKNFHKIISIGPKTIEYFSNFMDKSETIFFNCAMGFLNIPQTIEPLKKLLQKISQTKAYTIVGGGESVAALFKFNLSNEIDFCSTGGGSTLNFIAGNNMPGLDNM